MKLYLCRYDDMHLGVFICITLVFVLPWFSIAHFFYMALIRKRKKLVDKGIIKMSLQERLDLISEIDYE